MGDKEYSLDNIFNVGASWPSIEASSLFMPRILQRFLSDLDNQKLQFKYIGGTLVKSFEDVVARIEALGGRCVVQKYKTDFMFIWKDSYIDIDYAEKTKTITFAAGYLDQRVGELIDELEKDYITKTKKNLIFSIIQTASGLEARSLGDGSSPLITDNYLPEVLEDINFVIECFKKTPPPGRICILNGEPGTGKTHLIRSVLMQLDCVFLIIPSNLIDSMDKPNFMPLLLSIKDQHEKPIVMVIEDGDTCIVPRKSDNISAISSLLNLSDGILGSIMDIRMIISTNAAIKEIDEAIKRPGRLCKQIHVGPLGYDQANKVYRRLMVDETVKLDYRKFYTLAEIYSIVNCKDAPIQSAPIPKRVIGFSSGASYNENTIMNKKE